MNDLGLGGSLDQPLGGAEPGLDPKTVFLLRISRIAVMVGVGVATEQAVD